MKVLTTNLNQSFGLYFDASMLSNQILPRRDLLLLGILMLFKQCVVSITISLGRSYFLCIDCSASSTRRLVKRDTTSNLTSESPSTTSTVLKRPIKLPAFLTKKSTQHTKLCKRKLLQIQPSIWENYRSQNQDLTDLSRTTTWNNS